MTTTICLITKLDITMVKIKYRLKGITAGAAVGVSEKQAGINTDEGASHMENM